MKPIIVLALAFNIVAGVISMINPLREMTPTLLAKVLIANEQNGLRYHRQQGIELR